MDARRPDKEDAETSTPTELACEAAGLVVKGEGEPRWRDLVNALPAAIYTTDAAGLITFYNEAAVALWGRKPEIGKSEWCGSWKLHWPDGTPMAHSECPMAVSLRTGKPVRGVEAVAERPDGTRVPFMPYPTPLRGASGKLLGAVNMLVDLTEVKRGEQDGQRLAAIVESSDDAIVGKDLNGFISSWNRGAEQLFGYLAEEVIGKSVTVLIPPESHNEEPAILERLRRGERIDHYETVRRRKGGSLVDISLTVSPIKNASGRIVGASKIARDISDRKKAETLQRLLARELHHRTKNLIAVVQSVVSRSFAGKRTVEEAQTAVLERLHSLGQAHILLIDRDWQGIELMDLASGELRPFSDRVSMSGPPLVMNPQAAQCFALALHELATNAAKYGALSSPTGRVALAWSVDMRNGAGEFTLGWEERNGPPVTPPARRGFGSSVLEQVMAGYCDAPPQIDFAPSGLTYLLKGPLDAIAAEPSEPGARAAQDEGLEPSPKPSAA
jgi:two-component system CheB/CheR fusion protein